MNSRTDWTGLRQFMDRVDGLALGAILGLLGLSLVILYSITHAPTAVDTQILQVGSGIFTRQVVWVVLGLGALYVGFWIPFRLLEATAWAQYAIAMILLVVVLFMPHRAGVERWIVLGPLQFQPSEFAKVAIIFVLARYLAQIRGDVNRLRYLLPALAIVIPPVMLILKQPNLGTALVFFALLVPMLFWSGLRVHHIILLASPALLFVMHLWLRTQHNGIWWPWLVCVLALFGLTLWRRVYLFENTVVFLFNVAAHWLEPALWSQLHDYQQRRISTFFQPDLDRLGQGYHVAQSKIAVGSGGWLGKGFMEGTQKELAFLPERHTDFIYSVVGEEFGFLGAVLVLALFAVLVVRGIAFASRARNPFVRYTAFGIVTYILFQVMQNIGMTVGLFPVAGIPLPLVSYGGSSLFVTLFLLGVLLNLGTRWREY
jgi:rod shape determining protein RodA